MKQLLEVKGVSKFFPGVKALENVDFSLNVGEIIALVGANGAGKSTLIKTISGVYKRDAGEIKVFDKPVFFTAPGEGKEAGISTIYQELTIIPALSVAENIFLSQVGKSFFLDKKKINSEAEKILNGMGFSLDVKQEAGNLSIANQQLVEIARAISENVKILIMDEPTSSLTDTEKAALFAVAYKLRDQGVGIVFVSHRMKEVFELCTRATILRDGKLVGTFNIDQLNEKSIVQYMMGEALDNYFPKVEVEIGETILEAKHLSSGKMVKDVSFELRRGEILGLTGLLASGRTETARCICGVDKIDSGEVTIDGKIVNFKKPSEAKKHGVILTPEDRKKAGLALSLDVAHNLCLGSKIVKPIRNKRLEKTYAQEGVKRLSVKCSGLDQTTNGLSGGNQQKLIIARALAAKPEILILDEPTRGIDVIAKSEIHHIICEMLGRGVSVILISSEFEEIVGMCDRACVLYEGESMGIVERKDFSEELLLQMSHGKRLEELQQG